MLGCASLKVLTKLFVMSGWYLSGAFSPHTVILTLSCAAGAALTAPMLDTSAINTNKTAKRPIVFMINFSINGTNYQLASGSYWLCLFVRCHTSLSTHLRSERIKPIHG